jgi:hypothetical protein
MERKELGVARFSHHGGGRALGRLDAAMVWAISHGDGEEGCECGGEVADLDQMYQTCYQLLYLSPK